MAEQAKNSHPQNPEKAAERKPDPRRPDDDSVGKVYDSRLMRRLAGYLRPYWWQAVISSIAVSLKSLSDVAGPLLVMVGIDRYFPAGPEAERSIETHCLRPGALAHPPAQH